MTLVKELVKEILNTSVLSRITGHLRDIGSAFNAGPCLTLRESFVTAVITDLDYYRENQRIGN
jgi:hypothetical protein